MRMHASMLVALAALATMGAALAGTAPPAHAGLQGQGPSASPDPGAGKRLRAPPPLMIPAGCVGTRRGGTLLCLGDSLTSGFDLDPSLAYPSLLQTALIGAGSSLKVINAGVSGDTSAGAMHRLDRVLDAHVALVVLAIGANDGLRGLDLDATERNIATIIARVVAVHVPLVLAGMALPPNYGPDYTARFHAIYGRLARRFGVPLIPFLLEGVAARTELNLPDGIHPNAHGHKIVAATIWKAISPVLLEAVPAGTH